MGLTEFNIKFMVRTAIKTQVLADFPIELANPSPPEPSTENKKPWTMYFDGLRSYGRSGAGILIISPQGEKLRYIIRLDFPATNNMAEYEALLAWLRVCMSLGV